MRYGSFKNQWVPRGSLGLCLFFAALGLFAQSPAIVPAGAFPVPGQVSELRVMQDPEHGVYVCYIAGGKPGFMKGDGRGSFEAYQVEGLPDVSGARCLELSASGPEQYAAFIGSEGGTEGVYVLGLDFQGGLKYYPVPETRVSAGIAQYHITSSGWKGAAVYVLADGQLSCTAGIGDTNSIRIHQSLTNNSEKIANFELIWDPLYELCRGWFTAARNGRQELVLFAIQDRNRLLREPVGLYDGDVRVQSSTGPDGDSKYTVIRGDRIEIYREHGGGFIREQAFTAPVPVHHYYTLAGDDAALGILIGGAGDTKTVYGAVNQQTGVPGFQQWFSVDAAFEPKLITTREGATALVYKRDGSWYAAHIPVGQGLMPLNLSPPGLPAEQRIEGPPGTETLFIAGRDSPRLYFRGADRRNIAVYELRGNVWELRERIRLPDETAAQRIHWEAGPVNNPLYWADRFIPIAADTGLVLFDPETGNFQLIENDCYHVSRNINQQIFIAAYTGETVVLYRVEG